MIGAKIVDSVRFRGWFCVAAVAVLLTPLADVLAQTPAPADEKSTDVPSLLKAANDALDRKDFEGAVKALNSAIERQPDMPEAWFTLAYAFTGMNKNEEAVNAYKKALELDPGLFEAHLNLGILLVELKRPEEAIPHLAEACELKPDHALAHLFSGRALAAAGKSEAARRELQEALRLDPSLAAGRLALGELLLAQKDFGGALDAFTRAAELDPTLTRANRGRALALDGLHRPAEAAETLEKYLTSNPQDLDARTELAQLYLDQGQVEKAIANLQAIRAADPRRAGIIEALGNASTRLKKFADAEKYYREAIAAQPQSANLRCALADNLMHQERFPDAEAEFRACLKFEPKNLAALRGLAMSLYLQKRYPEAIPLFEVQAAIPDAPAGVFFLLATSYDHLHILPKALENYQRFLRLSHNQSPEQEWQAQQRAKLLQRQLNK